MFGESDQTDESNPLAGVDPSLFPSIDLTERSPRHGGLRYVAIDGGKNLGDTNTGRTVFPIKQTVRSFGRWPVEVDPNAWRDEARENLSIADG